MTSQLLTHLATILSWSSLSGHVLRRSHGDLGQVLSNLLAICPQPESGWPNVFQPSFIRCQTQFQTQHIISWKCHFIRDFYWTILSASPSLRSFPPADWMPEPRTIIEKTLESSQFEDKSTNPKSSKQKTWKKTKNDLKKNVLKTKKQHIAAAVASMAAVLASASRPAICDSCASKSCHRKSQRLRNPQTRDIIYILKNISSIFIIYIFLKYFLKTVFISIFLK